MDSWKRNLRAASSTSSLDGVTVKTRNVIKKKKGLLSPAKAETVNSITYLETATERREIDKKSRSTIEISKLKTSSKERFHGVRKSVSSEVLISKDRQNMKSRRVKMLPHEKMVTKKSTLTPQYPSVPDIRKSSSMGSIYHHGRIAFGKNKFHSELKISKYEMEESDVQAIGRSLAGKIFCIIII